MATWKYTIGYYFKSLAETIKERIHRDVYMRKLRYTIKTAKQLHQETGRKYYVMHDFNGEPTIINNSTIKELKDKNRIPKEWDFTYLEKNAIYIAYQLSPKDFAKPKVNRKWRQKKIKTASHETPGK